MIAFTAAADLKLAELADSIRRRQESGFAAAQAAVADNVGKRVMDDMRAIVARMEGREDALLAVRTAEAVQSYRAARVTGFASTGVAIVVLLALFVGTRRFGVQRVQAAETAERLKVTLASIGDGVGAAWSASANRSSRPSEMRVPRPRRPNSGSSSRWKRAGWGRGNGPLAPGS